MSILATLLSNFAVATAFLFVWVQVVHEHETALIRRSYEVLELSTIPRERKSNPNRAAPTLISKVVNTPAPASIHDRSTYTTPSPLCQLAFKSKPSTSSSSRCKSRTSVKLLSAPVVWRGMQDFKPIESNKGIIDSRSLAENELKQRLAGSIQTPLLSKLSSVVSNYTRQTKATSFERSLPYSPRALPKNEKIEPIDKTALDCDAAYTPLAHLPRIKTI